MKTCFIETFGCQMNKSDSEKILGTLTELGYKKTDSESQADILILNTCTIRENASHRALSRLGSWKKYKINNPEIIIILAGCLAQERGLEIQKKFKFIDIVLGTTSLINLKNSIENLKNTRKSQILVNKNLLNNNIINNKFSVLRESGATAWIDIILGCNFNCTYCIVPSVRGREVSKSPELIKAEIEQAVSEQGCSEACLLGQNVTAYGLDFNNSKIKDLADLLVYIHEIKNLKRIRYLTGHPVHVSEKLIKTVAGLPKVCESFYLPMQSGDNNILKKMARIYNREYYLDMVDKIRKFIPDAHIMTDFIVGFPGETQQEFENTCDIVERVKFSSVVTAMYSARKNTVAGEWEKNPNLKISDSEKQGRINILNKLVNKSVYEFTKNTYENTEREILVEGPNPQDNSEFVGKTSGGKICHFSLPANNTNNYNIKAGDLIKVKITEIQAWNLRGEII